MTDKAQWTIGKEGKGLVSLVDVVGSPRGTVYTWNVDKYGSPHHIEVAQDGGMRSIAIFTISPAGEVSIIPQLGIGLFRNEVNIDEFIPKILATNPDLHLPSQDDDWRFDPLDEPDYSQPESDKFDQPDDDVWHVSSDYRGVHMAPGPDNGAPMYDLTSEEHGIYSEDLITHPEWYCFDLEHDLKSYSIAQRVRDKPDAPVRIYRAGPVGKLNPGDWVTPNLDYAKQHAKHPTDSKQDMPVWRYVVPASSLFTDGNSLSEWGFDGPALTTDLRWKRGRGWGSISSPSMSDEARKWLSDWRERRRARPRNKAKTAKETLPQQQRRWQKYLEYMPDTTELVYRFGDGWTVRRCTTREDTARIGSMMRNCWAGGFRRANEENHALYDPMGLPRVAFYVQSVNSDMARMLAAQMRRMNLSQPIENEFSGHEKAIVNPLGVRNKNINEGMYQRLNEFAQAEGIFLAPPQVFPWHDENPNQWWIINHPEAVMEDDEGADFVQPVNEEQPVVGTIGEPQALHQGSFDDERYDHLFEFQEHDYDPRWDYEIDYSLLDDPLLKLAQQRLDQLAQRSDTPFERGHVYPVQLSSSRYQSEAVGVYCSGTYNEPVILIDIPQHDNINVLDPEDEVIRTIDHEVAHAIREADYDPMFNDDWVDEEEAENWRFSASKLTNKLPLKIEEQQPQSEDIESPSIAGEKENFSPLKEWLNTFSTQTEGVQDNVQLYDEHPHSMPRDLAQHGTTAPSRNPEGVLPPNPSGLESYTAGQEDWIDQAQIVETSTVGDVSEHFGDEFFEERRPWIYDSNENVMFIGGPNQYHHDVMAELMEYEDVLGHDPRIYEEHMAHGYWHPDRGAVILDAGTNIRWAPLKNKIEEWAKTNLAQELYPEQDMNWGLDSDERTAAVIARDKSRFRQWIASKVKRFKLGKPRVEVKEVKWLDTALADHEFFADHDREPMPWIISDNVLYIGSPGGYHHNLIDAAQDAGYKIYGQAYGRLNIAHNEVWIDVPRCDPLVAKEIESQIREVLDLTDQSPDTWKFGAETRTQSSFSNSEVFISDTVGDVSDVLGKDDEGYVVDIDWVQSRRPWVYDHNTDKLFIGGPNQFHKDIISDYWDEERYTTGAYHSQGWEDGENIKRFSGPDLDTGEIDHIKSVVMKAMGNHESADKEGPDWRLSAQGKLNLIDHRGAWKHDLTQGGHGGTYPWMIIGNDLIIGPQDSYHDDLPEWPSSRRGGPIIMEESYEALGRIDDAGEIRWYVPRATEQGNRDELASRIYEALEIESPKPMDWHLSTWDERDQSPERTPEGDYIFYHGTSPEGAESIRQEGMIRPDDMNVVGLSTTPGQAQAYAAMKKGPVLRIIVKADDLAQFKIQREIGGSGRNQFDRWPAVRRLGRELGLLGDERPVLDRNERPVLPPSGDEGLRDSWKPGSTAWFEYHCYQGHDSADAALWYRSQQEVTVLGLSPDSETEVADLPVGERLDVGMPMVWRVRFADGREGDVFDDELFVSRAFFRPDGAPPPLDEIEQHDPEYAAWLKRPGFRPQWEGLPVQAVDEHHFSKQAQIPPIEVVDLGTSDKAMMGEHDFRSEASYPLVYVPAENRLYRGDANEFHWDMIGRFPRLKQLYDFPGSSGQAVEIGLQAVMGTPDEYAKAKVYHWRQYPTYVEWAENTWTDDRVDPVLKLRVLQALGFGQEQNGPEAPDAAWLSKVANAIKVVNLGEAENSLLDSHDSIFGSNTSWPIIYVPPIQNRDGTIFIGDDGEFHWDMIRRFPQLWEHYTYPFQDLRRYDQIPGKAPSEYLDETKPGTPYHLRLYRKPNGTVLQYRNSGLSGAALDAVIQALEDAGYYESGEEEAGVEWKLSASEEFENIDGWEIREVWTGDRSHYGNDRPFVAMVNERIIYIGPPNAYHLEIWEDVVLEQVGFTPGLGRFLERLDGEEQGTIIEGRIEISPNPGRIWFYRKGPKVTQNENEIRNILQDWWARQIGTSQTQPISPSWQL